ncbi:MAG: CdaR family protein [candidate division WOR-3 bacterium]
MKGFLQLIFKDLYLKILALIIAILIYFNAVMERTVTMTLKIPIVTINLAEGQVVADKNTDRALLTIQGKGKDFIGLNPKRYQFQLDLSNTKIGVRKIKLIPEELGLPPALNLKSIDPEYVELTIDRLSKKPVTVSIPFKGNLDKGLALVNITPKSDISLIGPKEDITFISVLNTESLNLAEVKESKDVKLKVIPPTGENFRVEPDSVEVSIQIEKETARIFLGIPLAIEGLQGRLVELKPAEAQIAVAGPESKLKNLKPWEIKAKLNLAGLTAGTHQVRAEITLPTGISLVKCEPAFFQVKIR